MVKLLYLIFNNYFKHIALTLNTIIDILHKKFYNQIIITSRIE
jgi:hypothetical protein